MMRLRWAAAPAVVLALLAAAMAAPAQQAARDELAIVTGGGARHVFRVEVARTRAEQARGLMYRRHLAADAGMLFVYRPPQHVSMWMKNTLIPLDMLFIDAAGRVVKVAERTVPLSRRTIASGERVRAVLELNGGTAERLGIEEGARVVHPVFESGG